MPRRGELSVKQRQALPLIVGGMSYREVAKHCRVSTRTVERWPHVPKFAAALELAREDDQKAKDGLREMRDGQKFSMARFKSCLIFTGITEDDVAGRDKRIVSTKKQSRALRRLLKDPSLDF